MIKQLVGVTPTPAQLRVGVRLMYDHPLCFDPELVKGAKAVLDDLDHGIMPTTPSYGP